MSVFLFLARLTLPKVNQNLDTPVGISAVRVEGAKNTSHSFLGSIIYPAISQSSANHASTLGDVLQATRSISRALNKTNIFSSVEVEIARPHDPLAASEGVDLLFKTKEKGRYHLSSSTELGNNEGSAVCIDLISSVILVLT
jgi:outer membrane protein insertion porin family